MDYCYIIHSYIKHRKPSDTNAGEYKIKTSWNFILLTKHRPFNVNKYCTCTTLLHVEREILSLPEHPCLLCIDVLLYCVSVLQCVQIVDICITPCLSLGSLHWTCTHVCILYCLFIYALIFFFFFYLNVFLHFIYMSYIYSYFPAHVLLAWTAYHSGASELTPLFLWGSCYAVFSFLCSVCRSLCVIFVLFPLVIVLSAHLRFIPSDYL